MNHSSTFLKHTAEHFYLGFLAQKADQIFNNGAGQGQPVAQLLQCEHARTENVLEQ